jgi:hypothetical protein
MEKESELVLKTLREYVGTVAGQLELRAVFPDGDFAIETLTPDAAAQKRHPRAQRAKSAKATA